MKNNQLYKVVVSILLRRKQRCTDMLYLPKYTNDLDMEKFIHMLDDTTECYKFYWFDAILSILATGKQEMSFDEIINEMIANAWYSVSEYHLHLGLKDASGKILNSLERAINKLIKHSDMESTADKDVIIAFIKENDKLLHDEKYQISKMVPYRLLSPFLTGVGGNDILWHQTKRLIVYIDLINESECLPYKIIDAPALKKKIVISEHWKQMFLDNFVPIRGWIKMKKVKYLQDRNPGVPGIVYKLEPENENTRQLTNVRVLWNEIIKNITIKDIYNHSELCFNDYEVDHFIPWSYVANDELWNLIPMDSSLNSSKSNKLPDWKKYFQSFASTQYILYQMLHSMDSIKNRFSMCQRDNLLAIWANEELYIPGHSRTEFIGILEHHMKPIYDSARVQGYSIWDTNKIGI